MIIAVLLPGCFLKECLINFNFSFIVLHVVTIQFVIVLINEHDDDDDDDDDLLNSKGRFPLPEFTARVHGPS